MDKYYHFTNHNCFYNIANIGLIPQNGFRCQSIDDDECGVFLSKGIENSIIMYASMFSYYNKYKDVEGLELIKKLEQEIEELKQKKMHSWEIQGRETKIYYKIKAIERLFQIRNCNSFNDYLGGYGRLLSVKDIFVDDNNHPEDCCYKGLILPEKISLIYLENKYINEVIYAIEPILYYLINYISLDEITKNAVSEYKDNVQQLYTYLNNPYFYQFNPCNYDLKEIPISYYNYNNSNKNIVPSSHDFLNQSYKENNNNSEKLKVLTNVFESIS